MHVSATPYFLPRLGTVLFIDESKKTSMKATLSALYHGLDGLSNGIREYWSDEGSAKCGFLCPANLAETLDNFESNIPAKGPIRSDVHPVDIIK
jgi:hypothetical protein